METKPVDAQAACVAQRTDVGLVEALFRMGRPLLVVYPLNALLTGCLLWPFLPATFVIAWWAAVAGITLYRYRLEQGFTRRDSDRQIAVWRRHYVVLEGLSGLVVGLLGVTLFFLPQPWPWLVILICLLTIAGGALVLSAVRSAYLGFSLTAATLLATLCLASSMPLALPCALLILCCTGMLWFMSDGCHRILRESLRLRFTNESLVADLDCQRRRAEQASSAKSAFLANMCHEIRTPMHGMLASLELLGRDRLTPDQQQWQLTALHSGRRLLTLLNDILDLSKVEHGHLQPSLSAFSPSALVDEAAQLMRASAETKGLHLRVDRRGLPAGVISDPGWLRQILLNLLGNAVKFSDRGDIRLEAVFDANRRVLQLTVVDKGRGMSDEQIAQLFEPYTRFDEQQRYDGSGLGLAISRKLTEQLNGELNVSSALGQGSCFRLRIPAETTDLELPQPVTQPAASPEKATSLPPLRVLVAEDDAISRRVVLAMLADLGISADWVENGQRVLDRLAGQAYDLILMDWQMPQMDGLEATRNIRRRAKGNAVPIVVLTAQVTEGDEARCLHAGADEVIAKPLGLEALEALVQRYAPAPEEKKSRAALQPG